MSRTNSAGQRRKATGYYNPALPGIDCPSSDEAKDKDFYPTPKSAFEPLMVHLSAEMQIWEPACGDRRLINWLRERGYTADGADIRDDPSYDFLRDTKSYECIVTNPPFSLAQEFVEHAINNAGEVWMLLPLGFLGAQKRRDWWRKNEPGALYILSERPSFTGDGATDAAEYAWFSWKAPRLGIFHL